MTPLIERRRRKRDRYLYQYVPRKLAEERTFDPLPFAHPNLGLAGDEDFVVADPKLKERQHPARYQREKGALWMLVTTIATILLVYQLASLSTEYLQYETDTDVVYAEPEKVSMPGVSICFDAFSIVNKTELHEKYPNKSIGGNEMSSVSVSDIFSMTPPNDTLIVRCQYKTNNTFGIHQNNQEGCYKFFEVMKYQKLHKLCYDIRARIYWLFLVERVTQGLQLPGNFLGFALNLKHLRNVSAFDVTIHDYDTMPRGADVFPSYISRNGDQYLITSAVNRSLVINVTEDESGSANGTNTTTEVIFKIDKNAITSQIFLNSFTYSFAIFCNFYLPAPYPPSCMDYVNNKDMVYKSQEACKDACMDQNLGNQSNKLPDSALIPEEDVRSGKIDGNKQVFSTGDYDNSSLVRLFTKYHKLCAKTCARPNCIEKFYGTQMMDAGSSEEFFISIFSYNTLPFYTHYTPKMKFTQFLVQFLSCFGIWLTVDFTTLIAVFTQIHKFFAVRYLDRR